MRNLGPSVLRIGGNTVESQPGSGPTAAQLGALKAAGALTVDAGAEKALRGGKSLLPAGVKRVEGGFSRGDTVSVITARGREIARGLVAYDAADATRIAGLKSGEIEKVLGFRGRDELIHRDDMVLMGGDRA